VKVTTKGVTHWGSSIVVGPIWATARLRIAHSISIGFKSGEFAGHPERRSQFSSIQSRTFCAVWHGAFRRHCPTANVRKYQGVHITTAYEGLSVILGVMFVIYTSHPDASPEGGFYQQHSIYAPPAQPKDAINIFLLLNDTNVHALLITNVQQLSKIIQVCPKRHVFA
jgi:hypothetical protein